MPIIDVEIVLKQNETLCKDLASNLSNALGEIFNSATATTWVKVHVLSDSQYAENSVAKKDISPVFVKVTKSKLHNVDLRNEAIKIAGVVANICERPVENVHIMYEPEGSGRIAFGGKIIS